jgi:ubiquinone/menaquinone biosynthesis C-methylase UbiE
MSFISDYKRQFLWRDWPAVFEALPLLNGQSVLDLGCGVGDLAAEFVARGANVIGVDFIEEFVREARSRNLSRARFEVADLRALPDFGTTFDGVWSSFTAAYFTDLPKAISDWTRHLKPGGWMALVEIDDLFGHEPLSDFTRSLLEGYAGDSLTAGRYDFRMGRKLKGHLQQAGFEVTREFTLVDLELSFDGLVRPEVVEAWRNRFKRMKLLREFCGRSIDQVEDEFLSCLTHADHRTKAKVYCCIGIHPPKTA